MRDYDALASGVGAIVLSRRMAATGALALICTFLPFLASAQVLPSGWKLTNVGKSVFAGSGSGSGDSFTVSGGGSGLSGRWDQFTFVHRTMSGDGVLLARFGGVQGIHPAAIAGVMLRESLSAGSKFVFLGLPGSNTTLQLLRRTGTNRQSGNIAEVPAAAPLWLRLERRGSTVTASRSSDGVAWAVVGDTYVSNTSTLYVGLVVANPGQDGLVTATFSSVAVQSLTGNQAPAVSLSSPSSGASYVAPANVTISAMASDQDGTVAQVSFYAGGVLLGSDASAPYDYTWSGVTPGSYALTAVARDDRGLQTVSASRSITVTSPPANEAPSVSLMAPATGASYAAPASVSVSATATDSDGTVARVDFYAGSTLIGSATSSPYSAVWTGVPAGSYSLNAIARDNAGASTVSASRAITVTSNQPPSVSLSTPVSDATFTAPASITVSASAGDADGTIARVDFYAGSTLIGSVTASPYSVVWTSVPVGSYSITALARDNVGATTTSSPRLVTVVSNQSPTISMTTPVGGTTFVAPVDITASANASDPDGTIARVEFYSGSTLLGSDTTSPYSVVWSQVTAGQYSLTAVARDNLGSMTVSGAQTVTVTDPQIPGHALFVPSSNHDTAVDRYLIEIFPNGTNPTIDAPVATQDLGKPPVVNGECQADISQTVTALSPGTYIATITAIGSAGSTRSSASSPFTR